MNTVLAWLLLLIGILITAAAHLLVPWIVAAVGKPLKPILMWLFAILGSIVGFVLCNLLDGEGRFFNVFGLLYSAALAVIGFFIIRRKCKRHTNNDE
ncbi:MAG: hypothetical protein IIX28_04540 [Clostridia bacterium]|nr:hypothetical protein [Clostridia bacterium]